MAVAQLFRPPRAQPTTSVLHVAVRPVRWYISVVHTAETGCCKGLILLGF